MPKVQSFEHEKGGHSRRGRRTSTSLAEINVVPLVDVMLVLLIIFMVTAPMMQRGLEIQLPVARRGQPITAEPVYVTLPLSYRKDKRVAIGPLGKEEMVPIGVLGERARQALVSRQTKQSGIELHGDTGSIHLSDWQLFDASVELARFGEPYQRVPVDNPYHGTDWGRALGDLSDAIVTGRPHRATGAHAAHIVEILDATAMSVSEGRSVEITSSFDRPQLGWNGSSPS